MIYIWSLLFISAEQTLHDELCNTEVDKEVEKKMQRKREGSGDKQKHYNDSKEGDERRLPSRKLLTTTILEPGTIIHTEKFVTSFISELGMGSALETMCGQAYDVGDQDVGYLIYMQSTWVILLVTGKCALWMMPQSFAYAVNFPIQKFLQSQRKRMAMAWISLVLVLHTFLQLHSIHNGGSLSFLN